ncbi:MAG: hypothetical protein JWM59_884 [Verrucomicrobiales bacterium]|nr:hypothetical protein [Verrucomicrobiales bacterium]
MGVGNGENRVVFRKMRRPQPMILAGAAVAARSGLYPLGLNPLHQAGSLRAISHGTRCNSDPHRHAMRIPAKCILVFRPLL